MPVPREEWSQEELSGVLLIDHHPMEVMEAMEVQQSMFIMVAATMVVAITFIVTVVAVQVIASWYVVVAAAFFASLCAMPA